MNVALHEIRKQSREWISRASPDIVYAWEVAPEDVRDAVTIVRNAGWDCKYPTWKGDLKSILIEATYAS